MAGAAEGSKYDVGFLYETPLDLGACTGGEMYAGAAGAIGGQRELDTYAMTVVG